MHKIHFRPGESDGEGAHPFPRFLPFVVSISRHTDGRIGPRDNVFPGPAVALTGLFTAMAAEPGTDWEEHRGYRAYVLPASPTERLGCTGTMHFGLGLCKEGYRVKNNKKAALLQGKRAMQIPLKILVDNTECTSTSQTDEQTTCSA